MCGLSTVSSINTGLTTLYWTHNDEQSTLETSDKPCEKFQQEENGAGYLRLSKPY